jgi:predicted TPR repeat methyltransferase
MNTTISILAEIPEDLHQALTGYLETHANWDHDSILAAALSLFLLQSGTGDRRPGHVYLETLYDRSEH